MRLRVGHLYPDYLNIYADRGNIAVLAQRAAWHGLGLDVTPIGLGETPRPGEHDLLYIGGGQDREQALIALDIAAKSGPLVEAVANGAVVLAVCGGYQLLGRFYRDRYGSELPGAGVLPLHTVAGERRMIGDVLLECELEPGVHGPLLPRNPWIADWLLANAAAHRTGAEPLEFEPLDDAFEAEAHSVAAARARARGGKL